MLEKWFTKEGFRFKMDLSLFRVGLVGGVLIAHLFENPNKNSTLDKNMFGINLAFINFRYSCFNSPVD